MARTPLLRLLSILFAFTLIASSCSDDVDPAAIDTPADDVLDPAENPDETAETDPDDAPVDDETVLPGPIDIPAEAQAYCVLSFALAKRGVVPAGDSPAEAEQFYASLITQLDSMIEVAPPEILADVTLLHANFQMVYDILAAADWDVESGLDDVEAWAADPQIADPMDDSIDRMSSYDDGVCGIDF